jgi:hypothetical protein
VHFDRWIIVSVEEDHGTREVCRKYGLECVISRNLSPDGKDFDAAHNKARVINEALDLLEPRGWVLVLDADVLLPRHFRERLEAQPLEAGCLYGTLGRKVCEDPAALESLRQCEPWDRLACRHEHALGYFNLFSLQHLHNRYLPSEDPRATEHDDLRFTRSFDSTALRTLPIAVAHAGPVNTNWAARTSKKFVLNGPKANGSECISHSHSKIGELMGGTGGSKKVTAIVGYFPGGPWWQIARHFDRVFLIDLYGIHQPSGNRQREADRSVLQRLWQEEAACLAGVELLGPYGSKALQRISDGSLDLLHFSGEVSPDSFAAAWPHWRRKLNDAAIISGDLFGLPHWREATTAISLLLGVPDHVAHNGFWWKRMLANGAQLVSRKETHANKDTGIIFINSGTDSIEGLLLSLYSVRENWRGAINVYHWGVEHEPLKIACSSLGADLFHVGPAPPEGVEFSGHLLREIYAMQPFGRSLLLKPGMLAAGTFDHFDRYETAPDAQSYNLTLPLAFPLMLNCKGATLLTAAKAQLYANEKLAPPVLDCSGDPDEWTEEAWEVWSLAEAGLASAMAAEVRIPADISVACIVTPETIGAFQRNWLTWRFRNNPPVFLFLIGVAAQSFWLPGNNPDPSVIEVPSAHASDLCWILQKATGMCNTSRVAFIPPTASASPGAELWLREGDSHVISHDTAAVREEESMTGNRFLPEPFFGMLDCEVLEKIAFSPAARRLANQPLSLLIRMAAGELLVELKWSDVTLTGWLFPPTHFHWRNAPRISRPVVATAERPHMHLKYLADDVVVISLPERLDRRNRITEMMAREGLAFRFVDGVRVAPEEIDPNEIAEVGWASFKNAGGWERYLCGMVGCRRAHLRCLREAYDTGLKSILIVEDDMNFEIEWQRRLETALAELPSGWLQLYFSANEYDRSEPVSRHLRRLNGAYQTTAILYSETGIEVALKCLQNSRMEIDCWMGKHLHLFGGSYVVQPHISFQDGGMSDTMCYRRGITS